MSDERMPAQPPPSEAILRARREASASGAEARAAEGAVSAERGSVAKRAVTADSPVVADSGSVTERAVAAESAAAADSVSVAESRAATGEPIVEAPSSDVATGITSTLPGEHRGGFSRAFTAPVLMPEVPVADDVAPDVRWIPPQPAPLPRSAPWALVFAILGIIVSLLVGWGFPIGLVGIGLAIVALRRPWESTGLALWALCLSILSLVYSAGWLWWASTQGPLFG